ncbi:hypothetical protein VTO73DRAFT_14504 [Trametes versicolor]
MATSGSSAVAAQYVAEIQSLRANLSCGLATTALLLYDVLLTSGQEYRYIWRSRKSWISRILYVCNRYMYLLYLLLNPGTIPSISDVVKVDAYISDPSSHVFSDAASAASCTLLVWLTKVLNVLDVIGPAMFTTLRLYALSRKSKTLGGVALVLGMTPFIVNASVAYQVVPINLPEPLNCNQINTSSTRLNIGWVVSFLSHSAFCASRLPINMTVIVASRGSLILLDSLAAAVTWRQTRAAIQLRTGTEKRPSLEEVMWENGIVYFCTLFTMNVVNMVLVLLAIAIEPGLPSSYVLLFVDPMSSILNSRFLLALHETNARLEGTADESISSLSLDTGSGDDRRAGSPELPEFLGVLGGSIHSFHDEDEDLRSLTFARPQEEEHEAELEGEIQEIGRDGGNTV